MIYDAIVAGLGAAGSAAAFHLARRGAAVLGLDRYTPPHPYGSSHGGSRIIRQAYFEHPQYVPLVQRAYHCWAELERLAGMTLLERTGGLMIGTPGSAVVSGARQSAALHGLIYDDLSTSELQTRFPVFTPPDGTVAVWEPDAGVLDPERCVKAHLDQARVHGASLRYNEPMQRWETVRDGSERVIRVTTSDGSYLGRRLVVAAGAWTADLLPELALPLVVERCVQHWFLPLRHASAFTPAHFPVFIWEYAPGLTWYGIPTRAHGIKLALHHQGDATTADSVNRTVGTDEVNSVRALIAQFLPDANGALRESTVCCYTNTPDEHFIIDTLPSNPAVVIVSPCSGHGFKFSSVIGETIADLVMLGSTSFDLTPFRISRFARIAT